MRGGEGRAAGVAAAGSEGVSEGTWAGESPRWPWGVRCVDASRSASAASDGSAPVMSASSVSSSERSAAWRAPGSGGAAGWGAAAWQRKAMGEGRWRTCGDPGDSSLGMTNDEERWGATKTARRSWRPVFARDAVRDAALGSLLPPHRHGRRS